MPQSERRSFTFENVHLAPDEQIGLHQQSTWELSYVIVGSGMRLHIVQGHDGQLLVLALGHTVECPADGIFHVPRLRIKSVESSRLQSLWPYHIMPGPQVKWFTKKFL